MNLLNINNRYENKNKSIILNGTYILRLLRGLNLRIPAFGAATGDYISNINKSSAEWKGTYIQPLLTLVSLCP